MDTLEKIHELMQRYRQALIITLGVLILFLLREKIQDTTSRLIFLYLFAAIAYKMDGRIPVAAGLILLVGAALFVSQGKESFANQVAIYAYYFLVIGVVLQVMDYVKEGGEVEESREIAPMKEFSRRDAATRYIAVASGKGGVGKTTIAANLGVALSKMGVRVTVVDMDLAMPNLEIITGLKSTPVGLIDVLEGRVDISRATYTGPGGVKVIPPGVMLEGYKKNMEKIRQILKEVSKENGFIILDMPPGRESVDVLDRDAEALLIVNPNKASVLDALNMKLILEKRESRSIGVILNRAEGNIDVWIEEIEDILEISVVGVIPESKIVKEAFDNEECFVETKPESEPSKEIMRLAEELGYM